jgi:signal transduction histidine kinase
VLGVLAKFIGFWHDQWWRLLPWIALAALALYQFHHVRLAVRREVRRIREQIARDLHDDIGASLSQIALLSEVVGRRLRDDPRSSTAVMQIGSLSREVLRSVSDTVWSLDPHSDTVGDTIERMRDFAGDLFAARNIAFHFQAPSSYDKLKLGPYPRRQLFLVFKEVVNNIVRHAECSEVEVNLAIERQWLYLTLNDNGKGFHWDQTSLGHGLNSMQERARSLSGQFQVASSPQGTRVTLEISLKPGPRQAHMAPERMVGKESTWRERLFASASSKINA